MEITSSLDEVVERIKRAKKDKEALSLGYQGNVVDLWERLAQEEEMLVVFYAYANHPISSTARNLFSDTLNPGPGQRSNFVAQSL